VRAGFSRRLRRGAGRSFASHHILLTHRAGQRSVLASSTSHAHPPAWR
jgi:hypothetical protein